MNFKNILTIAALTGFSASVAIGQGTAPTIVQGDYVSNVFGQSNFVKNPNAKLNTKNVSVSSATVTRSATTPLVATSEYNVAVTSANGTVSWATRSFDAGMKNQNCEARFSYRGFQATSKAQIKQGANVVAELTLTPSATDPRIASINFPCGDLSAATTFVITDSATLSGTNEIGGIYVGLATNQANVAQAEFVGSLAWPGQNANDTRAGTSWASFQTVGAIDPTATGNVTSPNRAPRVTIPSMTAGNYKIQFTGAFAAFSASTDVYCHFRITDGTSTYGKEQTVRSIGGVSGNQGVWTPVLTFDFEYTGATTSKTIQLETKGSAAGTSCRTEIWADQGMQISVYRFPSSSELVVTPETQNVFAGIKGSSGGATNFVTTSAWTKITATSTLTRTNFGMAKVESNNDYSITIENMPPGRYYVTASGAFHAQSSGAADRTWCRFGLADSASGGAQIGVLQTDTTADSSATTQFSLGSTLGGVYKNNSVATKTFFINTYRGGGNGSCYAVATNDAPLTITVIPLDNASNSALYVQGPVKAAATGAAIPAGYVGEVIATSNYSRSFTSQGGGSWRNITEPGDVLVTPPGNYLILFQVNSGTQTNLVMACLADTGNNLDTATGPYSVSQTQQVMTGSSWPLSLSGGPEMFRVRHFRTTTTATHYIKCYWDSGSTVTTTITGKLTAIRLN